MPRGGIVTIEISPNEAREVGAWLKDYRPAVFPGRWGDLSGLLQLKHDTRTLARKFLSIASRKRIGGRDEEIAVQVSRRDALWLASRFVRLPGMFAARRIRALGFPITNGVCEKCLLATTAARGRRTLTSFEMEASMHRGGADPRNVKRLRKRYRQEAAKQQRGVRFGRILADAIADLLKST
jgi:hypothetical protein